MKLLALIFLVCSVAFTHGYMAKGFSPEDKMEGHPNQCWEENLGYVNAGAEYRLPKECGIFVCEKDGSYTILGCGTALVEDHNCRIGPGDLRKPYPACCHEVICTSDE